MKKPLALALALSLSLGSISFAFADTTPATSTTTVGTTYQTPAPTTTVGTTYEAPKPPVTPAQPVYKTKVVADGVVTATYQDTVTIKQFRNNKAVYLTFKMDSKTRIKWTGKTLDPAKYTIEKGSKVQIKGLSAGQGKYLAQEIKILKGKALAKGKTVIAKKAPAQKPVTKPAAKPSPSKKK